MNNFLQLFSNVSNSTPYRWFITHNLWITAFGMILVMAYDVPGDMADKAVALLVVLGINNLIGLWKAMG